MPIQPMTFQPLTFDQANPFWAGVQRGEQAVGGVLTNQQQALANQLAKATLPYAAPSAEQQLKAAQLANALKQNELQYAPQMSQAELAYKQTQTPYLQAQTGEANAQTALLGQQAKYYPIETLIKAQQANQSVNRFGQAYQLAKALQEMPAPTRATWIAENQDQYNQMVTELANGQNRQQSLLTPEIMIRYFPGSAQPEKPNNIQQVLQQMGSDTVPNYLTRTGQPLPMQQSQGSTNLFAPPSQELNTLTKKASMMAANKSLSTTATQRQMEGAQQVEGIVNDPTVQQQVINASQYAGAAGKGKAAIDALSQSNPKAYEDYRSLRYETMPLLINRIKTLDGMGATDSQREELNGLYTKAMDSWTSNPEQFIQQFNALTKMLDTVAQSVQKSASPIFDVNRLQGTQQIPQSNMQSVLTPPDQSGMVSVQTPDGKRWTIPSNQLDAALKRGAVKVNGQ